MTTKNALRAASLFAVLLAGSCAAPMNDVSAPYDARTMHPITVEPSYQTLKLSVSAPVVLMPDDEARFMDFVQVYMSHGNGAISVSAPDGPGSSEIIHYFGDRIAEMGVQPSRILVGTHGVAGGDNRVEIGYVTYVAHTDPCGDWSKNLGDTASNLPPPNFGCAVQHNVAIMVADPRDLQDTRALGPSDAARRDDVLGKYEKGTITQADKHMIDKANEQGANTATIGQ